MRRALLLVAAPSASSAERGAFRMRRAKRPRSTRRPTTDRWPSMALTGWRPARRNWSTQCAHLRITSLKQSGQCPRSTMPVRFNSPGTKTSRPGWPSLSSWIKSRSRTMRSNGTSISTRPSKCARSKTSSTTWTAGTRSGRSWRISCALKTITTATCSRKWTSLSERARSARFLINGVSWEARKTNAFNDWLSSIILRRNRITERYIQKNICRTTINLTLTRYA